MPVHMAGAEEWFVIVGKVDVTEALATSGRWHRVHCSVGRRDLFWYFCSSRQPFLVMA